MSHFVRVSLARRDQPLVTAACRAILAVPVSALTRTKYIAQRY